MSMKLLLAGPGTGKTTKIIDILKHLAPNTKPLIISFTNATVNDLQDSFQRENLNVNSDNCMTLHKLALKLNHLPDVHILNSAESDILVGLAKKLSIDYNYLLKTLNAITFGGMIEQCASFIKVNQEYVKEKLGTIELLIVDEFQDFNENEQRLIFELRKFCGETLILGDDDQCIYGFKNADSDTLISLNNDEQIEKVAHENICYRCPDKVVNHSKKLIENNKNRVQKAWNPSEKEGEIVFNQFTSNKITNEYILGEINKIKTTDTNGSILILSPVAFASESTIKYLLMNNVDYLNFFETKISYEEQIEIWKLRLIYGSNKLLNAILLLSAFPSVRKVYKNYLLLLKQSFVNDFEATELYQRIIQLSVLDTELMKMIESPIPLNEYLHDKSKIKEVLHEVAPEELNKKLEKLELLLNPSNTEFSKEKVNIMSIHKSKGLQADYVFILGLVEGIIPNGNKGLDSIEAQRRILYVGMTRAKKRLFLLSTMYWDGSLVNKVNKKAFKYNPFIKKYIGRTSTFIEELGLN